MKILGIDYGRKKVGLALSEAKLASPYRVIRNVPEEEVFKKVERVAEEEQVEKIVVGISEGEMGRESKDFSQKLKERISIQVVEWDETLTSKDAQSLSIEAGIKRKKRKEMEDAFAASLMLQSYLEAH